MSMVSKEFINGQLPYIDKLTELGFVLKSFEDSEKFNVSNYELEHEPRITVCVDQDCGLATFWAEKVPAECPTFAFAGQAHTEAELEPTFQALMLRFLTGEFN
jgi:hypothetical protein